MGAVLAAFGTALPESAVTFVAVVFGRNTAEKDLGVGAALGGPLVLSTLAYAVVGLALMGNWRGLGRTSRRVEVDASGIRRDQAIFLLIFAVNIGLGLVAFRGKSLLGWLFLAVYAVYVWQKMGDHGSSLEKSEPEPLKLRPSRSGSLGWAVLQTMLALGLIGFGSQLFVHQLGAIGAAMHWPAQMTALLLSPIATELPETLNALIWVRQGKERLALANISGAMMIQATVPSALGIFFTPWRLEGPVLISAAVTMAAMVFLWLIFRRGAVDARAMVPVCVLYGVFAVLTALYFHQRWEHVPAADHARQNPLAGQMEAISAGSRGFATHCQQCHGIAARGGKNAAPTLRNARLRKATDGDLDWFLRQGASGEGMPSWAGLPETERWQIVAYLKSIQ